MKNDKDNDEVLSFDELKKKFSIDASEKSEDVSELLGKLSENENKSSPLADENNPLEVSSNDIKEQPTEKDIYDDVMSSIQKNNQSPENSTVRRSKYTSEQNFIDVTDLYQKPRTEEEKQSLDQIEKTYYSGNEEDEEESELPEKELRSFGAIFKGWLLAFFPNKKDKTGEIIRKVIMDISVFTLIGCAVYYGDLVIQKQHAKNQQTNINDKVIKGEDDGDDADAWANFFASYPDQKEKMPDGMMAKYAYLYALNNDLVGWIKIPNSIIDVQVVKSANNKEYLKKDFYGNYSRYGCPFMDYRNDSKYLSQNTIVYGHHMVDGLVFAELSKYKTIDGFKESPIIEFDTLFEKYKFKVYGVFISNSIASQDNNYVFNYITPSFADDEDFNGFVKAIDERRLYNTGVDIKPSDKLITLSTCSYEFTDAKLVVVGRMLRDGESEKVDLEMSSVNENPRYPQVWYDKNGTQNPFADAPRWYPKGKEPTTAATTTTTTTTAAQ